MTIKVEGLDQLTKKLTTIDEHLAKGLRVSIQRICRDLKAKAQKIAPVDTGDLQGSAYYETQITSKGIEAEVGFVEPYATRQHEELTYRHLAPGQAKYLEQPLQQNLQKYIADIEQTILDSTK